MNTQAQVKLDGFQAADVLDPLVMGDERSMYALFDHLRSTDPLSRVEHPDYRPFWSLTRYDDIRHIGSQNDSFLSAPRTILIPSAFEDALLAQFGTPNGLETLIHMDRPKHLKMRKVTREWFLPRSIEKLQAEVELLAKEFVDRMQEMGEECDFVKDIALLFPLRIILSILGLPREAEGTMLRLTQEMFGGQDPELQRGDSETAGVEVLNEFGAYFAEVIEDRKRNPQDDLATVLANAEVDGEPMNMLDQASYFIITASAGHDTTSAAIGGGMKALLEHPEQLALWRDTRALDDGAAREIIRWVSPVRHMVRTATADTELHGKTIRAGDNVALWYPAANRDPAAFDAPNTLNLRRDPKTQLAFGYGSHMCLGQHLAVLELRCFFKELLPRLQSMAFNGEPEWIKAIFVGGLRSMPVRYQLT
ncbi:cytochrome P450 [Parahaliea mediterranea]|uniref:cytochrome P450 n=1 Tax=Parahaliea mediterranea TaxID=651086 RepID=UPI001F4DF389|nr:cytochrome P450 [Parahaliea mediterranea]